MATNFSVECVENGYSRKDRRTNPLTESEITEEKNQSQSSEA